MGMKGGICGMFSKGIHALNLSLGFGVTASTSFSYSRKAIEIQNNPFQASKIGAHQENTTQKRLRLTFTRLRKSYTYVSVKDLSRIKNALNNIMRGGFEDKGIGVQTKESI